MAVASCRAPSRLPPYKLRRVTAYIAAHLDEPLPLATLAAVVHYSAMYFAHLFTQATGVSTHQYVLDCRITRAKQLLTETDLPLTEIAFQVGCFDASAFCKLFRQRVGMTPRAYRLAWTEA